MNLTLNVWRQKSPASGGRFETHRAADVSRHHARLEIRGGSARVVETCAFCSFTNEYTKTLPQISESSTSSSSSGGSSGSSFGGGSSGGGGASRGY